MNKLIKSNWFNLLLEDLDALMTEGVHESRWKLIETYYGVVERIKQDIPNFERESIYGKKIVQLIAKSLQRGERMLYYALEITEKWPDINKLPDGKNASITKLIKYLHPNEERDWPICPNCGQKIKRKSQ